MSLKRDNLIAISNLPGGGGGGLGRGGGPGGGPGGFGIVAIDISLSEDGPTGVSPQSASMWLSSVDRMLMPASLSAAETDWSRPWQVRDKAASPGRW
jgi:hypothetical protein